MKKIKLVSLALENVGGVQKFKHVFDGKDATVTAQNGTGKTTLFTSIMWLLFNKNTEGKTQFGIRPVDANQIPARGLTVSVEAVFDIDGECITLKKINTENVDKSEKVTGFTSDYEIDGVPGKLKKEFDGCVAGIVGEEAFKALTDLNYFNSLPWAEQRKILIALAGNFGTPTGFEDLIESASGKKLDDYKKVLKRQRNGDGNTKGYKTEKDEIPVRIEEVQKRLGEYVGGMNNTELDGKRVQLKTRLQQIRTEREEVAKSETKRNEQLEQINVLKGKRVQVERDLANDTSGVQAFMDERLALDTVCIEIAGKHKEAAGMLERAIKDRGACTTALNEHITAYNKAKIDLPAEVTKLAESIDKVVETCPTCMRKLEDDKIEAAVAVVQQAINDAEAKNVETLKGMRVTGRNLKKDVNAAKVAVENCEKGVASCKAILQEATEKRDARKVEIDAAIQNNQTVDPKTDSLWQTYNTGIAELENGLVKPVGDQLKALDDERDDIQEEVEKITATLSQTDQIEQDKTRLEDLGKREKELAQLIADIDAKLERIAEYGKAESELIENAVNGMFEHVKFKLFDIRLNEGIKDTCVATYNGVSYPDLSTGQRILVGIDIINVLSEHYGVSSVLFIDRSETFTMWDKIKALGQVIKLKAAEGVTALTVEQE